MQYRTQMATSYSTFTNPQCRHTCHVLVLYASSIASAGWLEWQEQEASCSELHTGNRVDGPPGPDNAVDDSELGQCSLYETSISAMIPPLTTDTPDTRDSVKQSAGIQGNECHMKKEDTGAQGKDCSWTIDSGSNDGKTDKGTSPVTCSQTQGEADAINGGYRNQLSSKRILTKTEDVAEGSTYEGGDSRGDHQIDEAVAKPETLNTNLGSDLDLDLDLDWNVGLAFESKPGLDTNVDFSDVDRVPEQSAMQQPMGQPYGPVTSEINSTTPKVKPVDFSLLASELDFSSVISEDTALGIDLPGIFADATASENTKAPSPDVSNPSNIDGHAQVDPNSPTSATDANETISNQAPLHTQQEPRPSPPPTPTAESQSQPQVEQTVEANYSFPKDPLLYPRLGRQSYTQDQKPLIPTPPPSAQYQTYAQSDTTNLESQTVERKPTALANQIITPLAAPLPSLAVHTHPQASADPTHSQSSEVQPTSEEGAPGYAKVPSSATDWNATAGIVKEECGLGTETWAAASAGNVHTTENVWGVSGTTEGVEAKERNCESSSPLEAEYGQRLDMRTKWSSGAMPSSSSSCVGASTEIAIVKLVPMDRTWQISRTLLHPQARV
ncbi:hypothetical protein SARC_08414 [Sphaeroforma arctica JP610]|uniref:Uncharacterized protein n=1 Tax=Sphaeroforma arctica JP610 TaxID=667725 RepID=A0A0L0FR72_9EUKA|nr:hypothetical protein SARC_08414 [Sphaeroforma arctica JP610]KNC79179.1 hypothetical protein SARC_08414 [Sphaeroforma arctica JP610]|eukprot:XP_014153081.1 hypothetical protein SARC_08414 [Sphaeroforma arctica JP610]